MIRESLENVLLGLEGETQLDERLLDEIGMNLVPQLWTRFSYPSERKLAGWIKSLATRVEYFRRWDNKDERPKVFLLEYFFFPQTFLSAVLQRHARKNKISIDKLCFSFKFMGYNEPDNVVESGMYIGGFETQGMRYDAAKGYIEDLLPKTTSHPGPYILVMPSEKQAKAASPVVLPLYRTASRTRGRRFGESNLVLMIDCPSKRKADFWLTNGSAFICEATI